MKLSLELASCITALLLGYAIFQYALIPAMELFGKASSILAP